ncbi:SDR family NAD(P)-dependent oxidoreductase [Kiloniella sp.]|uniref:SDR family NAD(P)-dependent oxidoreductase n=1 Tax=Kiloniella sp. TaxID=1938587 RepID=UPI003A940C3D
MTKIILLTGATDGIGYETAKILANQGHTLLIHGRSETKLTNTKNKLEKLGSTGVIETYCADLSNMQDVVSLANAIKSKHSKLDVLINNAGVYKIPNTKSESGHDIRFLVNTIAPYLLTTELLTLIPCSGRVVNVSSAAQSSVDLKAIVGEISLTDEQAYAQSKLAMIMWSFYLAQQLGSRGSAIITVNPASFLASKMVKEAYGIQGNDLSIGVDILVQAALGSEFNEATGRYFDNDKKSFSSPHPDALDIRINEKLIAVMGNVIDKLLKNKGHMGFANSRTLETSNLS